MLQNRLNYNPDVLSCLANLSSDEVFTPPELANRMLDLLPAEIWRDPNATFLDPATKTGVFLREIARRLMAGLAEAIPDEQARRDHIFGKQLYGIAITELTALMSRRSVYCSKTANGRYSAVRAFATRWATFSLSAWSIIVSGVVVGTIYSKNTLSRSVFATRLP